MQDVTKTMQDINQLKIELKQKQLALKKQESLKRHAHKFICRMNESFLKDPVLYTYWHYHMCVQYSYKTNPFTSKHIITDKNYYKDLMLYFTESPVANEAGVFIYINSKQRFSKVTWRPRLNELQDLLVLMSIDFDIITLTKFYKQYAYKEPSITCNICLEKKLVDYFNDATELQSNFCKFQNKDMRGNKIDSCNCKINVCVSCVSKFSRCPLCRVEFKTTSFLWRTHLVEEIANENRDDEEEEEKTHIVTITSKEQKDNDATANQYEDEEDEDDEDEDLEVRTAIITEQRLVERRQRNLTRETELERRRIQNGATL